MNNLAVIERDGILVIDSRLVAEHLGIQHRSFFQKVILKYQQDIEEDWGVLRFQIAKLSQSSRGGRPERYALRVETVITVDKKGKAIAQFDGVGITYLAKRYGFGSNTKACRYWLESIGIVSTEWF